ncbi:MAG: YfhO family protein [Enterococcus sp.]
MRKNFSTYVKRNGLYLAASFFIPVIIMAAVYLSIHIYPGSERSVLASDSFSQFANFHASFHNMLHGKQSIFYTWNASLGLNYLSLISYYLGGIFTPLVFFFPNNLMPDALYFLTLLKIGSAGLSFWFLSNHTFKIPKWGHVALSTSYALMSFATAHSELIMWLDAFTFLPLIILGIHRLMDYKKPTLLFVSYLLLFLSNFYMGFMVGVFSFLYYFARLFTNWKQYKKTVFSYGLTSLLAGGASMIIILPAILDLRSNGEALSQITTLKTEATGVLDLLMKNMVGVYDTTKYGSIPFIYIGLIPLIFCIFYFVNRKIPLKNKLLFGSLFAILIASFYLVPLNLFWHGMHAPNMFLFRYAYLFSFLVILLAGYGWEQFAIKRTWSVHIIIGVLIIAFCAAWFFKPDKSYAYITQSSFILTIAFLAIYLITLTFYNQEKISMKTLAVFLLLFAGSEATANTNGMLNGILSDWNYASRSLFTEPYPDIKKLVDEANDDSEDFYRLENLDSVSSNDSFNYGYSGISMFSSIRNRNSSAYLDLLGYRSRGTNLNIRYANNTLLMDAFTGIKYNISKDALNKYGFTKIDTSNDYSLYENTNALPLAFLASDDINDISQPATDNLTSQTNLFNGLADINGTYFNFYEPKMVSQSNTKITQSGSTTTFTEEKENLAKEITWEVTVPANTQAYISLFPTDFSQLGSSTATITVNGVERKTQMDISGQYYDLGFYPKDTTVSFKTSFYGTSEISVLTPKVVGLNLITYQAAINLIKENAVDMKVDGRKATGTANATKDSMLVTTIPYDKGWSAKIDGKKVDVTSFKDAFIALEIPAGKHKITFSYLPQGFKLGAVLFVSCTSLFILYSWYLRRKMI